MRLLADENFPKPIVEILRGDGHDVLWARTDCTGCRDTALLDLAESEARILLTWTRTSGSWPFSVVHRSNNPAWFYFEFILRHPRISFRWRARLSRRMRPGLATVSIIAVDGIQMLATRKT